MKSLLNRLALAIATIGLAAVLTACNPRNPNEQPNQPAPGGQSSVG